MRSDPTDAERRLWSALRRRRLRVRFRRQQLIGRFIVDFVCLPLNLVVEVDGGQHNQSAYDIARDEWLRSQGFTVLRFWNRDVLTALDDVIEVICLHVPPE